MVSRTSTKKTEEIPVIVNNEKGTVWTVLVIIILCLVFVAAMGFAWLSIQDRLNANDAYRNKAIREQRDEYRLSCEQNFKNLQGLQEWIRQNPDIKPPIDLMTIKPCVLLPTTEDTK